MSNRFRRIRIELRSILRGEEGTSSPTNEDDALVEDIEETENKIKELTKATIRCMPLDSEEEQGICVLSGKPSSKRVLFAKAY